tara:strand:- start:94 stop:1713 length:1620 start_codon:yes stop_codon:yes gene_type:complete
MTKKIYVRDASRFNLATTSLGHLYKNGSKGVDNKDAIIDRATGFLQRLAQKTEWQINDHAKCKEYLVSMIKGSNLLDSFVIVPAQLVLSTVEERLLSTTGDIKEAWAEVKEFIITKMNRGVEHFIIDGQNRLFEAIIPFINNKITLSTEQSIVFVMTDKDGNVEEFNAKGRLFKDLPKEIQDWIKSIQIPVAVGTQGDLERFCDTLIWKNEGVAWDDWQKMITKNWFTRYLRQIRTLSDKDTSNPIVTKLLSKISGKSYEYEKNGWDRIISEILMWMVRGTEPSNPVTEVKQFFEGNYKVTQAQLDSLEKYIKEFGKAYIGVYKNGTYPSVNGSGIKGISIAEFKNYVYMRYAIDNPKNESFEGLSVPNWKISKPVEFASYYKMYNELLIKNPVSLGELPNRSYSENSVNGKKISAKTPGAYVSLCSQYRREHINARLEILFSVLGGRKPETVEVFEKLLEENVVTVLATDKKPSMTEIYKNNPFAADGEPINVVDHNDTNLFEIGHINPKSKGGSNEEVVLQKKSQNRKLQDNPIPSV